MGLRSIAGNFKSRKVCLPSVNSATETSRALVAAVPVHEAMCSSMERPRANDLMFSSVLAAVSRRNCMSFPPMWTFTTGSRSQCSIGISSFVVESCAETVEEKSEQARPTRTLAKIRIFQRGIIKAHPRPSRVCYVVASDAGSGSQASRNPHLDSAVATLIRKILQTAIKWQATSS